MKVLVMITLTLSGMAEFFGLKRPPDGKSLRVYVGTYTNGDSKGIYVLDLDLETGALSSPRLAAETVNPSFLVLHPSDSLLFAVNEVGNWNGMESGAVTSFRINPKNGKLQQINQKASRGGAPCFITVDASGRYVLIANYGGGSVASLPIGDDGKLGDAVSFVQHEGAGVNSDRQEGPHAHSINVDSANRFALAADLGLNKVLVYRFDPESGKLTPADPPSSSVAPGAGPRHLAFHPNGRLVYLVNELNLTISTFTYNSETGALSEIQTVSTLPDSARTKAAEAGYSTAEIRLHPSGRFVYASNRGHDTIAVYRVDDATGELTAVEFVPTQGRTPRNFRIDPSGHFLIVANQNSNSLVVFRIDQETGHLKATGHTAEVPTPVCVKFLALPI